tara:strand:- start:8434 stop:9999 length:1566 start_codon:yes stop_codon:yes gene_type:complete
MEQNNLPILFSEQRSSLFKDDVVFFYIVHENKAFRYLGQISHVEDCIVKGNINTVAQKHYDFRSFEAGGITHKWPEEMPSVQYGKNSTLPKKWMERQVISYDISIAIAPEEAEIKFPFTPDNCPDHLKPITTKLSDDNGKFVSFRVPWYQTGQCIFDVSRLSKKMEINDWFNSFILYNEINQDGVLPENIKCSFFTLKDVEYDYDITYNYKSFWRVFFRELRFIADHDGKPTPLISIEDQEMISGTILVDRKNLFSYSEISSDYQSMYPGKILLTRSEFENRHSHRMKIVKHVTPRKVYSLSNKPGPYDFRKVLQRIVHSWNLKRETVKVVKESTNKRQIAQYFFTYDNHYGNQSCAGIDLVTKHSKQFLQISDKGGYSFYDLKEKDIIYRSELSSSYNTYPNNKNDNNRKKKSNEKKEELRWLVSSDINRSNKFEYSNAYYGLDIFITFVLSEGKHKIFNGKKPQEIIDSCKLYKENNTFSDLLEGWFNPSISNENMNFFRKRFLWWLDSEKFIDKKDTH